MKVFQFSVGKEPPCTKVCTKTSLSRYYTLCFCIKQYNFHLFIYSQPPVVSHFTNWWHLSHFPWTTPFTCTFTTSVLLCYNFNGMIKWYDIFTRHSVFSSKYFFRGRSNRKTSEDIVDILLVVNFSVGDWRGWEFNMAVFTSGTPLCFSKR